MKSKLVTGWTVESKEYDEWHVDSQFGCDDKEDALRRASVLEMVGFQVRVLPIDGAE